MRNVGRLVFSVLCGVATGFIAKGVGVPDNGPFLIAIATVFIVQILIQ